MKNKKYSQPKIIINKVYTKKGDKGKTSIVGGHKVNKSSKIIKAFGNIDELNVVVGICKANIEFINNKDGRLLSVYFQRIQHELFNLGNMIATLPEDFKKNMPSINKNDIEYMENKINSFNEALPSLTSFILPGGGDLSLKLHLARVVCRRCERNVVELSEEIKVNNIIISYLNRLSDLFFVLSRWASNQKNVKEFLWNPNFKD